MAFKLSNALASFQGYINKILAKKLDIFVIVYLHNIVIYIKDPGQAHVDAVWLVLKELRKHGLFTKLKKCQFHKDKVCFVGYIISAYGVRIEDKRIKIVKNWPELKSVHDIQVFLGFVNFYQHFIQDFSKIAGLLISMLKTSSPIGLSTILQSIDVTDEDKVGESGGNKTNLSSLSASTRSTGAGYLTFGGAKKGSGNTKKGVKAARGFDCLTLVTKKAFNHLRHVFTQVPILQYFDLQWHIRIETDASGYAIDRVLS